MSWTGFSKNNFWGARLSCPALHCSPSIKPVVPQSKCCSTHFYKIPFSLNDNLNKCWVNNPNPKSTSPTGIRNSLRDLICSFSKFTFLLRCFTNFHYRRSLNSTLLRPRRCSETQFSTKHLLQLRWGFTEDILVCFVQMDAHKKCICIRHIGEVANPFTPRSRGHRPRNSPYVHWYIKYLHEISMQSIPQNQVKHRTSLSFPVSVYIC